MARTGHTGLAGLTGHTGLRGRRRQDTGHGTRGQQGRSWSQEPSARSLKHWGKFLWFLLNTYFFINHLKALLLLPLFIFCYKENPLQFRSVYRPPHSYRGPLGSCGFRGRRGRRQWSCKNRAAFCRIAGGEPLLHKLGGGRGGECRGRGRGSGNQNGSRRINDRP